MAEFISFVRWLTSDDQAKAAAADMKIVPLSPALANAVMDRVLKKITCNGSSVFSRLDVLLSSNSVDAPKSAPASTSDNNNLIFALVPLSCLLVVGVVSYFAYRRWRTMKDVAAKNWVIPDSEVKVGGRMSQIMSHVSLHSMRASEDVSKVTESGTMKKGGPTGPTKTVVAAAGAPKATGARTYEFYLASMARWRQRDVILFTSGCRRNPLLYRYHTCKRLYYIHKQVCSITFR